MLPLVSVIIITRDRPELLKRAIFSVAEQGYENLEIVLVDNCSRVPPDLADYAHLSLTISLYKTQSFVNASKSRNFGISKAKGDYICLLDDDDYYLPNHTKLLMDVFHTDSTVMMAYGNTRMLGVNNADLGLCVGPPEIRDLMYYRYIHLNSLMIKRSILNDIKFDETMTKFVDADLIFSIVRKYKCVHVNQELTVWNRDNRSDQITKKNRKGAEINWTILCKKFAPVINMDKKLARLYYKKAAFLALVNLHPLRAIPYLYKYLFYGFLKAK